MHPMTGMTGVRKHNKKTKLVGSLGTSVFAFWGVILVSSGTISGREKIMQRRNT